MLLLPINFPETDSVKMDQKHETRIIHTIVNRIDIRKTYRLIEQIDRNAFIVEFDVNTLKGGVLRRYFNPDKQTKLSSEITEMTA